MTFSKNEYMKEWRLKNKEYCREYYRGWRLKNKARIKEYDKKYNLKHAGRKKEQKKEWRLKNVDFIKEYTKEWRGRNKEHINKYMREFNLNPQNKERRNKRTRKRYQNDPNFRILLSLRTRLSKLLNGKRKSARTLKLLGCTIEELWQHLESRPTWEPWMTRENYGRGGWDIDHIQACTRFNLTDPEQQQICCHWSNLQPMEHIANIKKGNK